MGRALSSSDIVVSFPGFGFSPTNEVLIEHYLKPKIAGNDSDVDKVIVTIENINNFDPSELPRFCSKPWDHGPYSYFFCKWKKYGKGKGVDRMTKTGSWKITGKELNIKGIAKRTILVFYRGRAPRPTKTDYIIHLFEMKNQSPDQTEPYVLCRMHENDTKRKKIKFDTPNKVDLEMPIPPGVIPPVEGNAIGEQNNGLFSQSPDSTVLDGDGLSIDDTSNGDTPVPIAGAQADYSLWPEDQTEMLDSSGFFESEVSLEDMMEMFYVPSDGDDIEGVDGHGNSQVFPPENNHHWSISPSPDWLFPQGGTVPKAPTATQAFDDQAKHDPQLRSLLSPDSYWQFPPWFEVSDGNISENLVSDANHSMSNPSPHSPVHQHSAHLANSS